MTSIPFVCIGCPSEIFDTGADLSRHVYSTHARGKWHCHLCNSVITNKIRNIRFHVKAHTAEKQPCPLGCGKFFKSKGKVNRHLLSHTKEKSFKCRECSCSFNENSNLQSHIKAKHTFPDEKLQKCNQCGKQLKCSRTLKSHIQRIHTTEKNYGCPDCPMKFFTKKELTSHSETHKSAGERKLLDCYFCSSQPSTRGNLEAHLRIHTTEKPFNCPEKTCNYSAAHRSYLRRHVKNIHQSDRKHTCYFCSDTFTDNSVLVRHMRIHTMEEPFACEMCRKSYKSLCGLSQHVRTNHTKETPYKCKYCEKYFKSVGNLNEHMATHTKEKRFFCEVCSYSTNRAVDYKRHLKCMHQIV